MQFISFGYMLDIPTELCKNSKNKKLKLFSINSGNDSAQSATYCLGAIIYIRLSIFTDQFLF